MKKTYLSSLSTITTRKLKVKVLSGIILGSAIILYFFDPAIPGKLYPPSPFRTLTALYFPGCWTLRGLHQLLHGNLWAAFGLNPLMVLSLPYLIYSYICYSLPAFTGRKVYQIFIKPAWIWWMLKIILAYWILRNIPFAPFSWLAP
ncbi:MAG: DUF2752 domain-containing protein [Moorea sp. SIO4G2]|uniref:DUF2752 domain-containing protein n=1 Tax=Moorena bouillonii PNG TaxID=568701 RepID=A0A1U7MWT9_9CYAN|nr:DUF2752 domain-containing protein [Moorena bouillonii]NEO67544.1 DUF2752 domain-containing protein [Moorena sp. SIO4G2]OLT58163.1 hypothetical protein BJP37_03010 [Moorena bouillonii PNG]